MGDLRDAASRVSVPIAPVVTRTPTVADGIVYRWFDNVVSADRVEPMVSASRNGVLIHWSPLMKPKDVTEFTVLLNIAREVARMLPAGQDPTHLVTHERSHYSGPFVEVVRAG